MSTTRASTPRIPRTPRWRLRSRLGGAALAAMLGASWMGCSFGWDGYDPRLGSGGAASTGTGGSDPTTSTGDTSSSSSTGGASSSSSSSGGTGGSGGGPVHCGGTSVLADDFAAGDPGEVWDHYSGGTVVSETGGEAVVVLPNNNPNSSWGEFDTKRAYDFRGDSISIEVKSAGNTSTDAYAWFGIGTTDNHVEFLQQHGTLSLQQRVGGVNTSLKSTAYDPVAHRHWRLREDGQNTYWETSSDGASWTTLTQVPTSTLFPMDLMALSFGGGTDGGEVNPGEIHFDNLNGGGPPKEKWCPVSSFKDDFDDGSKSPAWERSWEDETGMLAEAGGKLVVTLVPNSKSSASYVSASAFDLTSSSVLIEVPSAVSTADGSNTRIELGAPGDRGIEMRESQGQLRFRFKALDAAQEIGSVLYSPMKHRWWRIRESANTLYWETAPDGKAWEIQAQLSPVPIPIDALDLSIGSDGWAEQPSPGVSSFDNLNLPPP